MEKKRLLQILKPHNFRFTRSEVDKQWGSLFYQSKKVSIKCCQRAILSTSTSSKGFLRKFKTVNTNFSEAATFTPKNGEPASSVDNQGKGLATSNSWINPGTPKKNRFDDELKRLLGTWIEPSKKKSFPFSKHPSRNSFTTPKENISYSPKTGGLLEFAVSTATNIDWRDLFPTGDRLRYNKNLIGKEENMQIYRAKMERTPITFSPSSGREVFISQKTNLIKAFRLVDITCSRNRVRREANMQRFHERPGLKRKRLKSQRWRERFLDGFKATVNRVQELRSQGW